MTFGTSVRIGGLRYWIVVARDGTLLHKELQLLCFDEGFAGSRGFPVVMLDVVLMSMVVLVTIVGLQAVGLILMIALMVIPSREKPMGRGDSS